MATFKCPACGERCRVERSRSSKGARVSCSSCGNSFVVKGVKRKKRRRSKKATTTPRPAAGSAISGAETEVGTPDAVTPPPTADRPVVSGSPDDPDGGGHISKSLIPGYTIESLIGQGGMGAVYKARQLSLERTVALKLLAKRLSSVPDFVRRFEIEAKALATLNHPNITAIYDRGVADDHCFFAMEFVEGHSLSDQLARERPTPHETVGLFLDICAAVAYSHGKGIIHRDLKPGNILVTSEGRVKVTDFGLAGMIGERGDIDSITKTNMVMGTVNYMAPEQRKDAKSVDHRADIYSLGVILYEMLVGHLPLGHFELPSAARTGELSPRIDEIVLQALAFERDQRYESVQALAGDLMAVREQLATAVPVSQQQTIVGPATEAGTVVGPADGGHATVVQQPASLDPANQETQLMQGAGNQHQSGVTLVAATPSSLPPVEVQQVERAAGRLFLLVLGLVFVFGALPALLPETLVPAPLVRIRHRVVDWLTDGEQLRAAAELKRRMGQARGLVRNRRWREVPDLLAPCLDVEGDHQQEALYLAGKSLVEWGSQPSVGGAPDHNILQEGQRLLNGVDATTEALERFPDLLLYRARVHRLLGQLDEAAELYRYCVAEGMALKPAVVEYALLEAGRGNRSRAATLLVTNSACHDARCALQLLPVSTGLYNELASSDDGARGQWQTLRRLASQLGRIAGAPPEYRLLGALALFYSAGEGERDPAPLRVLTSDTLPTEPLLQRLHLDALYALACHHTDGKNYEEAVRTYREYIAKAGASAHRPRRLAQARYAYGTILVTKLRTDYESAIKELQSITAEERENFGQYELALGGALFRSVWSHGQPRLPTAVPSPQRDLRMAEADAVLEKAASRLLLIAKADGTEQAWQPYLNACRMRALVSQGRWRAAEALEHWERLAKAARACSPNHRRYQDKEYEAYLFMARLVVDVPELYSKERFEQYVARVKELEAGLSGGKAQPLSAYVELVERHLASPEPSAAAILPALAAVPPGFGDRSYFQGLTVLRCGEGTAAELEKALAHFAAVAGRPTVWGGEALLDKGMVLVQLARLERNTEACRRKLDEAIELIDRYLKRIPILRRPQAEAGRQMAIDARAALQNTTALTVTQLRRALQVVTDGRERIRVVLVLAKKLEAEQAVAEGRALLVSELGKSPQEPELLKHLALWDQRHRSVEQAQILDGLVKAWQSCLQAKLSCEDLAAILEDELDRLPAQDAALRWEGLLQTSPANHHLLQALAERLEESGAYRRIVGAYETAVAKLPRDVPLRRALLDWQLRYGQQLLLTGRNEDGRKLLLDVAKGCRLGRDLPGLDVLDQATFYLLEGRAYRELLLRLSATDNTKLAIRSYREVIDVLGGAETKAARELAVEAYTDLAEVYLDNEAPASAQDHLERAIGTLEALATEAVREDTKEEIWRQYRQTVTNLAWSLYRSNLYERAVECAARAVKTVSRGDVDMAILYGTLVIKRRMFRWTELPSERGSTVIAALTAAVETDPSDIRVRLLLAEGLLRTNRRPAAEEVLNRAESLLRDELAPIDSSDGLDESDARVRARIEMIRGQIHAAPAGDAVVARAAFRQVIESGYEVWDGRYGLAVVARLHRETDQQAFDSAVAELASSAETEDLTVAQQCQLVDLFVLAGRVRDAVELVGRSSTICALRYRRAVALYAARRFREAESLFADVIATVETEAQPGVPPLLDIIRFRAMSQLALDESDGASASFAKVLALDAADEWTNFYLARRHYEARRYDEAEAAIARTFDEARSLSVALLGAAIALARDDLPMAKRRCQRAMVIAPGDASVAVLAALVAERDGLARAEVLRRLAAAAELAPTWSVPYEEQGRLLLHSQPAQALKRYEQAKQCPQSLSLRGQLGYGLALIATKSPRRAVAPLLESALSVDKGIRGPAAKGIAQLLEDMRLKTTAAQWRVVAQQCGTVDGEPTSEPGTRATTETTYDW